MTTSTATAARVPAVVYVLALTVFGLGTSEFMLAGLLPMISADLDVTIPRAGLLISGFAVGMTVGAPIMAVATLRLPRKSTLVGSASVFLLVHVAAALAPDYGILMTTRVAAAVAAGAFWAVAAVTSVKATPPGATARALGILLGGLTVANVAGVPLGTWIGQEWGWRSSFWAVAAVTAVGVIGVVTSVPGRHRDGESVVPPRLRDEVQAFRGPRLWLALATIAVFQAGVFAAFSYVAPLLTEVAGLSPTHVPVVLGLFGVGSLLGITVGGRLADRGLFANIIGSLVALVVVLAVLAWASGSTVLAVTGVGALGFAAFSIAPALNARIFVVAGDAPTLAASATTSAFNVGNTLGPWAGGLVISAGLGYVAPVWVAAGLALGALGIALAACAYDERRIPASRAGSARHVTVAAMDTAEDLCPS
jgi:DHA1 family chloramphenicol resistance protein-like MFS transporter